MDLIEFARRAVSVPFVERGRSWDGWDCWGLIVTGYHEVLGVGLPDYLDRYDTTHKQRDLHRLRRTFVREKELSWTGTDDPKPGDVAIILRQAVPIHIGLLITPDRILHAENGVGTVHEPLSAFRIEGFYRHDRAQL